MDLQRGYGSEPCVNQPWLHENRLFVAFVGDEFCVRTWLPCVFQLNRDGVFWLLLSVSGGSLLQFGSPAEKHVRLQRRLLPSSHDWLFERVTDSFDKGTRSGLAARLNVPPGFHRTSSSISDYFRCASVYLLRWWHLNSIIVSVPLR